jgi:predicted DNA-binding helix-hairpin-helix protein
VEVTRAAREELMRVPGIGELSARRIVRARGSGHIRDLEDLRAMGVVTKRAAAFITIRGTRPPAAPVMAGVPREQVKQLSLPLS